MRYLITAILLSLTIFGLVATIQKDVRANDNTQMAEVVQVVEYEDTSCHFHHDVYIETSDGNVWIFDDDGYTVGDAVRVVFDDMNTDDVEDDVIVDVRKVVR